MITRVRGVSPGTGKKVYGGRRWKRLIYGSIGLQNHMKSLTSLKFTSSCERRIVLGKSGENSLMLGFG